MAACGRSFPGGGSTKGSGKGASGLAALLGSLFRLTACAKGQGADIRQFGKNRPPLKRKPYDAYEESPKPVIAAIHGYALGGGLEIALGCHARVGIAGVQLGFPEVSLGIIPGAGGTQRAPRLTGMAAAAEFIASGRRLPAQEALSLGLLDAIEDGEPRAVALWRSKPPPPLCPRRHSRSR